MSRTAAALVLLFPVVASAEPPKEHREVAQLEEHAKLSVPFLFGADAALVSPSTSTGFVFGWRPELVFAWTHEHLGVGFGPYAESVGSFGTHQIWLGGGATAVGYFGVIRIALSGGLDVDFLHADPSASPVVGLFVGIDSLDAGSDVPADVPFGVRVDVRPALGPLPTTVIVSAQLDLLFGAAAAFLAGLDRGLSRHPL